MRLTFGKKLAGASGILVLLVTASTAVTLLQLARIGRLEERIKEARYPVVLASWEITSNLNRAMAATRGYALLAVDPAQGPALKQDSAAAWQAVDDGVAKLKQLEKELTDQADQDRLASVAAGLGALREVDRQIQTLAEERNAGKATELLASRATPFARAITDTLHELLDSQQKLAVQEFGMAKSATTSTTSTLILANVLVLLISAGLGFFFSRRFSVMMRQVVTRARTVAEGDLSGEDMGVASQDEFADLAAAVNEMAGNLRAMIQEVTEMIERVASASEEISSSASEQARGAGMQKDQAAQIATAMQEMAATVLRVSEDANTAAESARKAAETAHHGGAITEQTLLRMQSMAGTVGETASKVQALGARSEQIGEIIGVISDIADQTNLLALNAAIEAARAGEQGRGFAVVADEVRKLAERTVGATKEIAQMIKSIQAETRTAVEAMRSGMQQVSQGVESTEESGRSLKEIIARVEEGREMITHIAAAASQQSAATEQVNATMDRIAKITMEAASSSQQSAKACQELSWLAVNLHGRVGCFKLSREARPQVIPATACAMNHEEQPDRLLAVGSGKQLSQRRETHNDRRSKP